MSSATISSHVVYPPHPSLISGSSVGSCGRIEATTPGSALKLSARGCRLASKAPKPSLDKLLGAPDSELDTEPLCEVLACAVADDGAAARAADFVAGNGPWDDRPAAKSSRHPGGAAACAKVYAALAAHVSPCVGEPMCPCLETDASVPHAVSVLQLVEAEAQRTARDQRLLELVQVLWLICL